MDTIAEKAIEDVSMKVAESLEKALKENGVEFTERGIERICDEIRYAMVIKIE